MDISKPADGADELPGGVMPIGELGVLALVHSPDLLVVVDGEFRAVWASSAVTRVVGSGALDMVGSPIQDHVHPDDLAHAIGALGEATRNDGYHVATRFRLRRTDGTYRDTRVTATTFQRAGDTWMVLALRPVEDEVAIERRRIQLKALAQTLYLTCAGMHWYDAEQQVAPMLQTLAAITGARSIELAAAQEKRGPMTMRSGWAGAASALPPVGSPFASIADHNKLSSLPCVVTHVRNGAEPAVSSDTDDLAVELWLEPDAGAPGVLRMIFDGIAPIWDDANADVVALMAATLVATLRRCDEEHDVNEQATRDPLTLLMNRAALLGRLTEILERHRLGFAPPIVLFADLNHFKVLNDTHGHLEGDAALQTVATAIRTVVRAHDVAARVGGDEFVVVFDAPAETAGELATRVRTAVDQAISRWPGLSIAVGAIHASPYSTPDEVLERADLAMYRDKSTRRPASLNSEARPFGPATIGEK